MRAQVTWIAQGEARLDRQCALFERNSHIAEIVHNLQAPGKNSFSKRCRRAHVASCISGHPVGIQLAMLAATQVNTSPPGQNCHFRDEFVCNFRPQLQFTQRTRRKFNSAVVILDTLLASNFAEHGLEVPPGEHERRAVHTVKSFQFHDESCFIFTAKGAELARTACQNPQQPNGGSAEPGPTKPRSAANDPHANPSWDPETRQVSYRGITCIEFTRAAHNRQTVIEAFEIAAWQPQIRDPFPPDRSGNRKRRLHNTINALNRCQTAPLIHFSSADSGRAIRWTPAAQTDAVPNSPSASSAKTAGKARKKSGKRAQQTSRRKRASQPHRNRKKYNAT